MVKLTYNAKRMHARLMQMSDSNGLVMISVGEMCRLFGLSEITLRRNLNMLQEIGAVTIAEPACGRFPHTYRITDLQPERPTNIIQFAPYLERKRNRKIIPFTQPRKRDLCS
jgi:predicted ArsR family transcriptional regulator